jgi:hypothetical protein
MLFCLNCDRRLSSSPALCVCVFDLKMIAEKASTEDDIEG